MSETTICPKCGGESLTIVCKEQVTTSTSRFIWRCDNCGWKSSTPFKLYLEVC